ncbi:MAG: hypothetical protein R8G66_10705 [Cytophagales bacterium]|nr:hypothetical protein [Cytophagales bacterium]
MRSKITSILTMIMLVLILAGCRNKALNEGEAFKPKERHENITFHFDPIQVDGVDYLILERDNNNPHEGFGFMAFRANVLIEKQDSLMAYLQTVTDMQTRIYAELTKTPLEEAQVLTDQLLQDNLSTQLKEIQKLESEEFVSTRTRRRPKEDKDK